MNTFELTENHIKLLRNAYVSWDDCETGAPAIDPKRPYGNKYIAQDIHEILTDGGSLYDLSEGERDELERDYLELHRETQTALQIVLSVGTFEPGNYTQKRLYSNEWIKI
jgi:hypothetical protein